MLLLLLGCAPLYRPGLATTALFEDKGDLSVQGGLSAGGVEGNLAWAPAEHLGLRGGAQLFPGYARLDAGVGGWMAGAADPERGLRLGLWADVGLGTASTTLNVPNTTWGPEGSEFSGNFLDVGGTAVLGWEAPRVATGLALRGAWYRVEHRPDSYASGTGQVAFVEPTLFVRAGGPQLKGELQLGGWWPVWFDDQGAMTGLSPPLQLGLGLVWER